ncbi:MAG TPA: hypothetical protein VKU19_24785 [Bryobacteraceae bacterium]|nr:hypothetical protein [Bryobacteraceae bacterium]
MAPPSFAPAATAKGSSALKIVLVVLGIFAVLGIAAIGGVLYVGHRVKQAVVSKAASYGVDLNQVASSSGSSSSTPVHLRKPCEYLSKDDVSRIIGEPIERAVTSEASCEYFGPPGLAAKLGKQGISAGMKQLQANQQKNNAITAQGLNNLINGIGAQGGEERPLIMLVVDPDGKGQMTAIDLTNGIFGQIPGAQKQEIPGLGDRAVRFANLGLNVMKGSAIIRIVAGPIPDPDEKTVEIAKAILPLL